MGRRTGGLGCGLDRGRRAGRFPAAAALYTLVHMICFLELLLPLSTIDGGYLVVALLMSKAYLRTCTKK